MLTPLGYSAKIPRVTARVHPSIEPGRAIYHLEERSHVDLYFAPGNQRRPARSQQ